MIKKIKISALLIIFMMIAGMTHAQVGIDSAADFSVKDLEGNLHHLYDYLDDDKLVVIDFFTTNCGPCQTYASSVSASYDYFGCNAGNVVFLGINWGSDNTGVHIFDSIWGAMYPSVSGLQGGGNNVVDLYEVISYPTVILIAPDRSILNNHIWPPTQDSINTNVLAAGGTAMPCTVSSAAVPLEPEFRIASIQGNSITFNITRPEYQNLSIYNTQGKLVRQQQVSGQTAMVYLANGFYIASLEYRDGRREVLKFTVH